MRRRTGFAPVLGAPWIDVCRQSHMDLFLRDSALSWWTENFFGAVILDWAYAAALLRDVPRIACESQALARRVRRAFADAGRCPHLFVLTPKEPSDGQRA
jgi:hypothetical protein